MAFSYGFYNSLNGDRKYDSEDLNRMFDGVITDGVLGSVGDTFAVKAGSGNTVNVSSGRAWFDHTWSYNDAPMPITCNNAAVLLDRYDAIVLEVNAASDGRKNTIKVITGTEASNPVKPTMENTKYLHQYPFAYILRKAGSTAIEQAQIENVVGTSECPLCTGPLTTMQFDQIVSQWQSQFETWFSDVQTTLNGDVAGNLLTKINGIANLYYARLSLDSWVDTDSADQAKGLLYKQTAALTCHNSAAPAVSADSVFLSDVYCDHVDDSETKETLRSVLNIINDGVTASGAGNVTVKVRSKPEADIDACWLIQR